MKLFPTYFLVGHKNPIGYDNLDCSPNPRSSRDDKEPHCVICFPRVLEFNRFQVKYEEIMDHRRYHFKWITRRDYIEYHDAWELFPLESWIDYSDTDWRHTVMPLARGTWEVHHDIPNVLKYRYKGLTLPKISCTL